MKKFYSKLGKILMGFSQKGISFIALKKVIEGKLNIEYLAFFHDNLKTEDDLFFDFSDLFSSIKKAELKISDLEEILKKSKMPTISLDLKISRKERFKSYSFIFSEAKDEDKFPINQDSQGEFETMLVPALNISEDMFNGLKKDRWFSPDLDQIAEFGNKFSHLLRKYEIISYKLEDENLLRVWSSENGKKVVFVPKRNRKDDYALFLRRIKK